MAKDITYEAEIGGRGDSVRILQLFRKVEEPGEITIYEEFLGKDRGWEETQYARDSICGYGGACTYRMTEEEVKEFMDAIENDTIREYYGWDKEDKGEENDERNHV